MDTFQQHGGTKWDTGFKTRVTHFGDPRCRNVYVTLPEDDPLRVERCRST